MLTNVGQDVVVLVHDTKIRRVMARSIENLVCILEKQKDKRAFNTQYPHGPILPFCARAMGIEVPPEMGISGPRGRGREVHRHTR